MNDKYLVVKKADLEKRIMEESRPGGPFMIKAADLYDLELDDAEVIRHQDITAAPIFFHYSSAIRSLIELTERFNIPVNREGLQAIADHFHSAGVESESLTFHKIPDL